MKEIPIDQNMMKQLDTLSDLLCLTDLGSNKGNYGIATRQPTEEEKKGGSKNPIEELKIVDFRVIT